MGGIIHDSYEKMNHKARHRAPLAILMESGGFSPGGNDLPLWPQKDLTSDAHRLPGNSLELSAKAIGGLRPVGSVPGHQVTTG